MEFYFTGSPKLGKAEADNRVERSLYERANGYSYDAVKIFMPAGAKKPVYAPWERSTARAACYLRLSRLRSRFGLDHVVERLAVRAREGNELGKPALDLSIIGVRPFE
jgi:hypothetical protein